MHTKFIIPKHTKFPQQKNDKIHKTIKKLQKNQKSLKETSQFFTPNNLSIKKPPQKK